MGGLRIFRDGGWLALIAVAAGAAAYWPVTGSYFHADDLLMLYTAADGRAGELLVTPHGGHLLPIRNGVFLLHHALFGADPRGYYWAAYATHLVNVALLFALIRRASASARLACAGATLWAVAPLNEGALNWYAVYGHVLLATCLLGALLCLLRIDDGAGAPRRAGTLAVALLFVGALSFGVGVGIAAAMAAAAGLLIPSAPARPVRRWLRVLPLGLAVVYLGQHLAYRWLTAQPAASMIPALSPRQMLLDVPLMTAELLAYGTASLVGGGALLALPAEPLFIAGGIALLAVASLGARRDRTGRRLAACALLAAGAYGVVAVGRTPHLAPLGVTVVEAATWSRYHYAATALVALAICLALSRIRLPAAAADGVLVATLVAIGAATVLSPPAIDPHDGERAEALRMRAAVEESVAGAAPGASADIVNRNVYPLNYLLDRIAFPGWAALYVIMFPTNRVDGVAVRFIEDDQRAVAAARRRAGTRTAELLWKRGEQRVDP